MNPLNPWVALFEMLILLGLAFLLGRTIAWLHYRQRIETQQKAIRQTEKKLTIIVKAKNE